MTPNDILSYCQSNLKDVVLVESWGERGIFYNPNGVLKRGVYVLTVKEKDGDNDKGSMLNRDNVYRVNVGLRKQTFIKKFGYIPERPPAGKIVKMDYDFTVLDTIIPHPVYAWMSWACVLNPSDKTFEDFKAMIQESYDFAKEKFNKRKKVNNATEVATVQCCRPLIYKCNCKPCSTPCGRKGEISMDCTEAYREHIMYSFNGFCKVVIRYAAINAWRDRNRRRQKEISFEYLTEEKFYPLSTSDEFLKSPYEQYPVTICGQTIILTNGELAAALLSLPEKKREIIYLYFFGNYTQQEIADLYGHCKSTTWHYMHSALQMLQKEMEGFSHGEY